MNRVRAAPWPQQRNTSVRHACHDLGDGHIGCVGRGQMWRACACRACESPKRVGESWIHSRFSLLGLIVGEEILSSRLDSVSSGQ